MWVSVSFLKIIRLVRRLESESHVVGRLGSGHRDVGRLWSRVWVSASFQIFALTAEAGNILRGEGNCPGWGNVRANTSEGKCPTLRRTTVLELCH